MSEETKDMYEENKDVAEKKPAVENEGREDESRDNGRGKGKTFFRKKVCRFCSNKAKIDYSRGILSAPQSAKMKTAYVSAPLVGSIRCGNPEDEEESIEEYVSLPVSMFGKGDFYILRAKGDSMVDAGIDEDDLLVIERNCPALEGDIVVALDEDNQNTLKRYAGYDKDSGYYILEYENEARYPGKTIKVRSFQVQGVARHVIKSL